MNLGYGRNGKGGEIASNRQDEQEMTVLCLRILQAALVVREHPNAPPETPDGPFRTYSGRPPSRSSGVAKGNSSCSDPGTLG